jgi:hypothetical protein
MGQKRRFWRSNPMSVVTPNIDRNSDLAGGR